jgi:hypothetical protein
LVSDRLFYSRDVWRREVCKLLQSDRSYLFAPVMIDYDAVNTHLEIVKQARQILESIELLCVHSRPNLFESAIEEIVYLFAGNG